MADGRPNTKPITGRYLIHLGVGHLSGRYGRSHCCRAGQIKLPTAPPIGQELESIPPVTEPGPGRAQDRGSGTTWRARLRGGNSRSRPPRRTGKFLSL
jgi:hypothetical protein